MAACNVSLSSPPVENENLKRARKKLVLAVEFFLLRESRDDEFFAAMESGKKDGGVGRCGGGEVFARANVF